MKKIKRTDKDNLLGAEIRIINIGAETFYDSLKEQGVEVIHVDWHPPAGGDPDLAKLLDKLRL